MTQDNRNAGHRQRLREKYLKSSSAGLHDYEMIELLLTYVVPRRDVKPLAKGLLKGFGGIKGLFSSRYAELASINGIKEGVAALILSLSMAKNSYLSEGSGAKRQVRTAGDVSSFLDPFYKEGPGEAFFVLYLNTKNEVIGVERLHDGKIEDMELKPKRVIEGALAHNARSVVFVRFVNGKAPTPWRGERGMVTGLRAAAAALDIMVHDHIIKGAGGFLSARDLGWL